MSVNIATAHWRISRRVMPFCCVKLRAKFLENPKASGPLMTDAAAIPRSLPRARSSSTKAFATALQDCWRSKPLLVEGPAGVGKTRAPKCSPMSSART